MSDLALPLPAVDETERFCLNLAGFDGPFDLLLAAVRSKKLDVRTLSVADAVAALSEFLQRIPMRPDAAAGYAVTAAWLIYLKSRFLLPVDADEDAEELTPEEASARLARHLHLLEGLRAAAARLEALPRLGRDVFARGSREVVEVSNLVRYDASLYALMTAYGRQARREVLQPLRPCIHERDLCTPEAAARLLRERLSGLREWTDRACVTPATPPEAPAPVRRSAVIACLAACLEAARDGVVDLRPMSAREDFELRQAA